MEPAPVPPAQQPGAPAAPRLRAAWLWGAALVPAALAILQLGRLHPDEVYQVLEPAYFRAHGYGILAWEWSAGIRNWAIPGLFAWILRACDAAGIADPRGYRAVLELPQLALHAWALWSVYRYLGRRSVPSGALGAFLCVALYGPVVAFAGRTMSESFSTDFALIAVEALDRTDGPRRRAGLLGGLALGLSVVARYGSAVIVAAALVWLAVRREWRKLGFAVLAGAAVALLLGALDWATWGEPFHSFRAYVDFNVLSGGAAAQFGADPASVYLKVLATQAPAWAWVALPFALARPGGRLSLPLSCALVYFAAVSLTAHKEARFLYPALVLLALAAAPGLTRIFELLGRESLRRAALAVALAIGFLPFFLQGPEGNGEVRGDQFRAIVRATRGDDATGLLIVGEGVWGAGGFFYIGKNIPWTVADWPSDPSFRMAMADRRFDRAVTYDRRAEGALEQHGFHVVERIGRATVMAR